MHHSRYKIAAVTKNKIWPYKNTRLRFFFFLRNRNKFHISYRAYTVLKTIKWRLIRKSFFFFLYRYKKSKKIFRSKIGNHNKSQFDFLFKNFLIEKKKIKGFYGELKEKNLNKIFSNFYNSHKYYKTFFFANALESRLDVVLLRSKILPTIFACNRLINHYGVYVNNKKIYYSNYRLNPGDIIYFDINLWYIIISFFYYKLYLRYEIFFGYRFIQKYRRFSLNNFKYKFVKKKQNYNKKLINNNNNSNYAESRNNKKQKKYNKK